MVVVSNLLINLIEICHLRVFMFAIDRCKYSFAHQSGKTLLKSMRYCLFVTAYSDTEMCCLAAMRAQSDHHTAGMTMHLVLIDKLNFLFHHFEMCEMKQFVA